MDECKCYFPSDISIEKEIITGFGKKELRRTVKGGFVALILSLVLYFILSSLFISLTAFISITAAAGVLSIRPNGMNISFIDEVRNLIRYMKKQRIFYFEYLPENEYESNH